MTPFYREENWKVPKLTKIDELGTEYTYVKYNMGTIPPFGHIPQTPSQKLKAKAPITEGTAVNIAFYSLNPVRLKQPSAQMGKITNHALGWKVSSFLNEEAMINWEVLYCRLT